MQTAEVAEARWKDSACIIQTCELIDTFSSKQSGSLKAFCSNCINWPWFASMRDSLLFLSVLPFAHFGTQDRTQERFPNGLPFRDRLDPDWLRFSMAAVSCTLGLGVEPQPQFILHLKSAASDILFSPMWCLVSFQSLTRLCLMPKGFQGSPNNLLQKP